MSAVSSGTILCAARFRGKLGAAIAVINSLIVGFLTISNNILYFIDNKHRTRTTGRPDYEYAYIHAGISLITLGCLAMVVSIVLSYFATKSKWKMDNSEGSYRGPEFTKSTRTVLVCLIMMNIELFMAVIVIIIYIMYVVTMVLTSTVLKGKHEMTPVDVQRDIPEAVTIPSSARDYMSRSINPYNSQSSFM